MNTYNIYNPKVSIIIPVYNGANYLGEAIDSALAQTYANKEIIVVNDGSNDDGATEKVALSYGDKIRYFSKENGGVSTALNMAIKNADGEWISWLSHDDLYTNNKISEQIRDINQVKNEGGEYKNTIYYCFGSFIDAKGNKLNRRTRKIWKNGIHNSTDALIAMFNGYGIGGCGILIPKKMFEEVGFFDESMRYMQDVFMWKKAFIAGYDFFVNKKRMVLSRIHNMQTSTIRKELWAVDKEKVGMYLLQNLKDMRDSAGHSVMKACMYSYLKSNSLTAAEEMRKVLQGKKLLNVYDKLKIIFIKKYGKFRKFIRPFYYKIRFGVKR